MKKDILKNDTKKNEPSKNNHIAELKKYRKLFHDMANGLAFYEISFDKKRKPANCICLDVNKSMENILTKKRYYREKNEFVMIFENITVLKKAEEMKDLLSQEVSANEQQYMGINQALVAKEEQLIVYGKELKKEKGFTERIISMAQSVILVLDKKGKIITFNPYMEKLTGYKLKEMKGKDWFTNFLPKCDYNKVRKIFMSSVKNITNVGIISNILIKKGKERVIEWNSKSLKDGDGNIMGVISTGQDITARKVFEDSKNDKK